MSETLHQLSSRFLVPALIVVAVLLGSFLLSLYRQRLLDLLKDTRAALQSIRERVLKDSHDLTEPREQAFWSARRSEPRRPLISELKLLNESLRGLGQQGLKRLRTLDDSIAKHTKALAGLGFRAPEAGALDLNELRSAARSRVHTRALLFGLFGVAIAIGVINSLLLNEFFQGVLPAAYPFPNLFPDFQLSHLLSLLVFVVELAIGFVLHMIYREESDDSRTKRFFALGAWIALVGMLALEIGAYSLLSGLVHLPEKLGLDPTSPFYSLARYFLAFFGLGISLLLAGLGYLIGREYERQKSARQEAEALDLLKGYAESAESVDARMEQVKSNLESLKAAANELPKSIISSFEEAIGSETNVDTVTAGVDQHIERLTQAPWRDDTVLVRTQTQALRDLSVLAALFIALLVAFMATWTAVRDYFTTRGLSPLGASTSGIVIPVLIASMGYLCRHFFARGSRSHLSDTVSQSSRSGSIVLAICLAGVIAGTALLSTLAVQMHVVGESPSANIFFGLLLSAGLAALGSVADLALMAVIQVGYLMFLWSLRSLAVIAWLVLWLVDIVLAIGSFFVRLFSIPGEVLRRTGYAVSR